MVCIGVKIFLTCKPLLFNTEISKGCTYELINASLSEDETREEVVVEIAEALESLLPISAGGNGTGPLRSILGGGVPDSNETSDEPPLKVIYAAIVEEFEVEATDEGFSNFTAAITEITEAKTAACEGEDSVSEADIPRLGREYRALRGDIERNIARIRDIFGKMLCLSDKGHEERRRKRQGFTCPEYGDPCSCPPEEEIICVCEFFACLSAEDDIMPILGIADVYVDDMGYPCLAIAVDTTGSMWQEIAAAKEVIRNFLSSEKDGPSCYVLQPFNDLINNDFHPASKDTIIIIFV